MDNYALVLFASYAIGSFPTSFFAGRIAGVDLRKEGSKNLGATNVFRVLGWRYAVPVALVDIAKGALPVTLWAQRFPSEWYGFGIAVGAIFGHVFSIFLRFKGGKGVATATGAIGALAPMPMVLAAAVWGVVLKFTGYVSLASMAGALAFPIGVVLLLENRPVLATMGGIIAAFIVFTHRANVKRLLEGTENRFNTRKQKGGAS